MEDEQLFMETCLISYNTLLPRKPVLVINCSDSKVRKYKWNTLCYKWHLFLPKIMENNMSVSFFNRYIDTGNLFIVCLHLSVCIRQPKTSTFNLSLISKNPSGTDYVHFENGCLELETEDSVKQLSSNLSSLNNSSLTNLRFINTTLNEIHLHHAVDSWVVHNKLFVLFASIFTKLGKRNLCLFCFSPQKDISLCIFRKKTGVEITVWFSSTVSWVMNYFQLFKSC